MCCTEQATTFLFVSADKRPLMLEDAAAVETSEPAEEQIRLLKKANPRFRERHVESEYPPSRCAGIPALWVGFGA